MSNFNRYIVPVTATAREALQKINEIAIPNTALFVVDSDGKLIGSITDGDLRRGLLAGYTINEEVTKFMFKTSKYLLQGENNFDKVNSYKSKNIRFVPVLNKDLKIVDVIDIENLQSVIPADVVLMAGGKGERLKPLTDETPKPMLEVGGKPIIIRNIERLANFGITNFHVSVRHMADKIEKGLSDYKIDNTIINFVKEDKPLGTIGSINLIENFSNDTILLMNSDLLTNIDFQNFYEKFHESGSDMLVATIPYHVDVPYAVMNINEKEEVVSFSEKPRYTFYSNAGIYIFKKELIRLIPKDQSFDATHFMEILIANNKKLCSYPILGYWLDIGRMEDYHKAQEDVKHLKF